MTEACGSIAYSAPLTYKANSVGTINPECKIKILDQDEDGVGEICLKTKQLMDGYLNQPDLTKSLYTDDGWFRTGDLGYIDKASRLFVSGRSKDLIITASGKNIFPDDIEHHFSHLLDIEELCVYGQETDDDEEIVMVFRPSMRLETEESIKEIFKSINDRNATLPAHYQVQKNFGNT